MNELRRLTGTFSSSKRKLALSGTAWKDLTYNVNEMIVFFRNRKMFKL